MKKIKPLAKKHHFRNALRRLFGIKERRPRASDLLANLDEMHEVPVAPVEFETLCFDCPVCGTRKYMKIPKTRSDGYIIEKTIIDEQLRAEFEKMEENANAGK